MQKIKDLIKDLVEVFNGYYEQRDLKVAVAKNDFTTALKTAKLLPAGTKYEEEKKTELIKLIDSMIVTKIDTPISTNPNQKLIDDIGNTQGPVEENPVEDNENTQGPVEENPVEDNENTQGPVEETIEATESEITSITDPVEQIVEASEVAETIESGVEPTKENIEDTTSTKKHRK